MNTVLFLLFTMFVFGVSFSQSEASVITRIADHWNADKEFSVKNGRVDIVTETHAYEVEKAYNWKNSIGQALWYALQTNKKPGVILIVRNQKDYQYGMMLNSALQYAGLASKIDVLYYPQDIFPNEQFYQTSPVKTAEGRYWISSSGKRHNYSCRYYNNTQSGRFGSSTDGTACKICGG